MLRGALRDSLFGGLWFGAALLACEPASSETLTGALAKAYASNSELNAARAGVRVVDETVPIAKSGRRPTISAVASIDYASQTGTRLATGSFGIVISQMLFDGFQTRNSVRSAKARVRAANESLRNTEQNVLFNGASAFMDVIRDRQIAALRARNLVFLDEQVRAARERFRAGEGTTTDVAQAEASLAAAVAELAAARAQVVSSSAIYHQIVGEDPGKLKTPRAADDLPSDVNIAIGIANEEHPAINASEHLVDAAGFDVKRAEGTLLPRLTVDAELARNYQERSPDSALNPDGSFNSATIGLRLAIPLYQGGAASAKVRQSKETLGQARIEVDVTRDQVRAAVLAAWTQYQAAVEGAAANAQVIGAAQLALAGVIEERKVGQRTTLDVLDAQADVIAAQINLASAERDVVVASYAILSAMGRLSARRLTLAVDEYRPEEHFQAVADKWYGLRTPDGR